MDMHTDEPVSSTASKVEDAVCGMLVDPAKAKHRADHAGKHYSFCSAKCHDRFGANPGKYTAVGRRCWRKRSRPAPSGPARCIRRFAKPPPATARPAA
jgi:YHS domain-containing protein